MSREERRNYERMMRNTERGPSLPPAAKARAERNAARRAARQTSSPRALTPGSFTTRFWVVSILVALAAGYVAFSLQFHNMPFALYLGAIVTVVVLALQVGIRILRGRVARH